MPFFSYDTLPGDFYRNMPIFWFRDPRMTSRAKGRLAYLATHAEKYELTLTQMIAETAEGRDAVYADLAELVRLDYLIREQVKDSDSNRYGEMRYRFGPAAYTQQYTRNWGNDPKPAGQPANGMSGSGPDQGKQDVSAGQPANGMSGSGPDLRKDPKPAGQPANGMSGSGPDLRKEADTEGQDIDEPHVSAGDAASWDSAVKEEAFKNYQENYQPPYPHGDPQPAAPEPDTAVTMVGGKASGETPNLDTARNIMREVCRPLSKALLPAKNDCDLLVGRVMAALDRGWSAADLTARLSQGGFRNVDSHLRVTGILNSRIGNLPIDVPAAQAAARSRRGRSCLRHPGNPAVSCALCATEKAGGTQGSTRSESARQEALRLARAVAAKTLRPAEIQELIEKIGVPA